MISQNQPIKPFVCGWRGREVTCCVHGNSVFNATPISSPISSPPLSVWCMLQSPQQNIMYCFVPAALILFLIPWSTELVPNLANLWSNAGTRFVLQGRGPQELWGVILDRQDITKFSIRLCLHIDQVSLMSMLNPCTAKSQKSIITISQKWR